MIAELIERKAVDFEVIGSALAKFGPSIALSGDPGEGFCGTGPHYIRLFGLGPPGSFRGFPLNFKASRANWPTEGHCAVTCSRWRRVTAPSIW